MCRQVLRLTWKVRRENEPPESAQLNFRATFSRNIRIMTIMLGTDLDCETHKLCVSDEKQELHPKLKEKSPPESLPPVWDTFYQVDFSYTLNGFVIFWCPISSQQHSAACQADLK